MKIASGLEGLEEGPPGLGAVENLRVGELELADGEVVAIAGAEFGLGEGAGRAPDPVP